MFKTNSLGYFTPSSSAYILRVLAIESGLSKLSKRAG